MTMTTYPIDRDYASRNPGKCPVVTATASGNGVRVCGMSLTDDVCPRHGLNIKPRGDDMQEEEET